MLQPLSKMLLREEAGGKAFYLGKLPEMIRPRGAVILPTSAFKEHIKNVSFDAAFASVDHDDPLTLLKASDEIREQIISKPLSPEVLAALDGIPFTRLAVRSSADNEDGEILSFAGQYDSFVNVAKADLGGYVKLVWASLYSPRAISYRFHNKVEEPGAMAVLIQDFLLGLPGVTFTVDQQRPADTDEMLIQYSPNGVVEGRTDAFSLRLRKDTLDFKDTPHLSSEEQHWLWSIAAFIERRLGGAADIEWVKVPGATGSKDSFVVVQCRPLMLHQHLKRQEFKVSDIPLLLGVSVGRGTFVGTVRKPLTPYEKVEKGCILVVPNTTVDWEPLMRQAKVLITDHGCRTCHAAIAADEMGLPAVIGTMDATRTLQEGQTVTIDINETSAMVYGGNLLGV